MAKRKKSPSRLEVALEERDRALEQLARARAELDSRKQRSRWPGEKDPPLYPNTAAPGLAPPLRYVLVDELNARLKKAIGPAYAFVRRVLPGAP